MPRQKKMKTIITFEPEIGDKVNIGIPGREFVTFIKDVLYCDGEFGEKVIKIKVEGDSSKKTIYSHNWDSERNAWVI